jgi:hypothetical protein
VENIDLLRHPFVHRQGGGRYGRGRPTREPESDRPVERIELISVQVRRVAVAAATEGRKWGGLAVRLGRRLLAVAVRVSRQVGHWAHHMEAVSSTKRPKSCPVTVP